MAGQHGDDAVQEAYLQALTLWRHYNPEEGEFGTWFRSILKQAIGRTNNDALRKGGTNYDETAHEVVALDEAHQYPVFSRADDRAYIKEAFEMAKPMVREAVFEQLPYKEVADRHGVTESAVWVAVHRFKKELE
jgi:RNA polymerase sigma factor (sigma-70 family)